MANIILQSDLNAISPTEAIARAKEDVRRQASANRIPDQAILENHEAARGIPMEANEFIRRLQKMNSKLLIVPGGVPNAVAVRYPTKNESGEIEQKYITGFYLERLPEFSSVTVDNMGLPHREIRGWRSVLMALIDNNILDRKKVDLVFGPALGQRTGLWYRQLQGKSKN
jgi:hypothetical protein